MYIFVALVAEKGLFCSQKVRLLSIIAKAPCKFYNGAGNFVPDILGSANFVQKIDNYDFVMHFCVASDAKLSVAPLC